MRCNVLLHTQGRDQAAFTCKVDGAGSTGQLPAFPHVPHNLLRQGCLALARPAANDDTPVLLQAVQDLLLLLCSSKQAAWVAWDKAAGHAQAVALWQAPHVLLAADDCLHCARRQYALVVPGLGRASNILFRQRLWMTCKAS